MSITSNKFSGGGLKVNLDNTFTGSNTFNNPISVEGVTISGGDITQIRTNETDIATNTANISTLNSISGTDDVTIERSDIVEADGSLNSSTTDQTQPGGAISVSAAGAGNVSAIIDNDINTFFRINQGSGYCQYDFGAGNEKVINKYRIHNGGASADSKPNGGTIYGSNNASDWDTLGTFATWAIYQWSPWNTFVNSTPYRYIRISSSSTGGTYLTFGEIELVEPDIIYNAITLKDRETYAKLNTENNDTFTATTLSTGTSANAWSLGGYISGAPTPNGYLTITVGGNTYRIEAEVV